MVTTSVGKAAESAASENLAANGFRIIDRNWKTPRCEIDIIAKKDQIIYFVEVKYRSTPYQGEGVDYVTNAKLRKMDFAARVWCQFNKWEGDSRLAVIGVGTDGLNYLVDELLEVE